MFLSILGIYSKKGLKVQTQRCVVTVSAYSRLEHREMGKKFENHHRKRKFTESYTEIDSREKEGIHLVLR